MAPVNVIVTGMPGHSLVNLLVGDVSRGVTVPCVTSAISYALNLHPSTYFLVMRGRLLSIDPSPRDCTIPVVSPPGNSTAFVTLALRHALPGGKGGFGANLKGSAAASRPSSNFDACRDLHGRRVRTVRTERALARVSRDAHHPASSTSRQATPSSLAAASDLLPCRKRLRSDDRSPSSSQQAGRQTLEDSSSADLSSEQSLAADLVADKMDDVSRGVMDAVFSTVADNHSIDLNSASEFSPNKRRCVFPLRCTRDSAAMILDGYSSSSSSGSSHHDDSST